MEYGFNKLNTNSNYHYMNTLSSGEFLSFLYSEKSREIENNNTPGWSKWALWGIICSSLIYIYNILVDDKNNINASVVLSYFTLFLPWVLTFIHILFSPRIRIHSTAKVRKLKDEAPITFVITRTLLSIIGCVLSIIYFTNIYESVLWGCVCVANIVTICYIAINRNKFVSADLKTNVFSNRIVEKWFNSILILFCTAIYYVHLYYTQTPSFHRFEFEISFLIIVIILLLSTLINISQQYSIAEGIDRIIELYTGGYIKQEDAYKRYLNLVYGNETCDILETAINNLSKYYEKCEAAIADLQTIRSNVVKNRPSIEECNIIKEKISIYTKLCGVTIDKCRQLNNDLSDIIDLPTTNISKDNFTNACSAVGRTQALIRLLQKEIRDTSSALYEHISENVYCVKYDSICYHNACKHRKEPMAHKDKIKSYFKRFLLKLKYKQ